jgi:hypothetical protein
MLLTELILILLIFYQDQWNVEHNNCSLTEWYGMVFNTTFNNISVISWRSVLLVAETGVPRENHQPTASHEQPLSRQNIVSSTPRHVYLISITLSIRYTLVTMFVLLYKNNQNKIKILL